MKSLRLIIPMVVIAAVTTCADLPSQITPVEFSTATAAPFTRESTTSDIPTADLILTADELQILPGSGLTLLPEGLAIDEGASQGLFHSAALEAPIAFNAVVPQWLLEPSDATGFELQLRTSKDGETWTDWHHIHAQPDWIKDSDQDQVGEMVIVPTSDQLHTHFQYSFFFNRDFSSDLSILKSLRFTFINSTAGPTAEEMVVQQQELDSGGPNIVQEDELAYPKPAVISRDIWCTDPRCDYTAGLEHHPVTHLILHHTVSGTGAGGDSAAIVRAIWSFHAFTRGWGDIGYNFLVDLNGVLYEGHAGGDDVVGTHASGANTGSMGLAMIGDYRTVEPPAELIESITNIFAWKADQRNIDVFDSSNDLPGIEWGLPHIMGHRDVYGTTECPGNRGHDLIPPVRDEVAARIGQESTYFYVDELSEAFVKSSANWHEPVYQCGYNNHSWYSFSTTDAGQSTNRGEWRPVVPANGRYEIQAYVPYCNTGRSETVGATYKISHPGGTETVTIDQNAHLGLWASLGEYNLESGSGNVIQLSDLTTTDDNLGVWFDALRLRSVEPQPAATNINPGNGAWLTEQEVNFSWSIDFPEKVISTRLEVARDPQFTDIVAEQSWSGVVENAILQLSEDFDSYYWRVIVESDLGNTFVSQNFRFGIDSTDPVSAVISLIDLPWTGLYSVGWTGVDNLTGISSFVIEVQHDDETVWSTWLNGVTQTSGLYELPTGAQSVSFRSQAVDNALNVELPHPTADKSTAEAISLSHAIILPAILAD